MKFTAKVIPFAIAISVAVPAFAQPHPRDQRHPDPPRREDQHRADEEQHRADEAQHRADEHQVAVATRLETEAEERNRLLSAQEEERARRRTERKDEKAWEARREQRGLEERNSLRTTWGPALDQPEARTELGLHADRMARLNRILDLAQDKGDAALTAHAQAVVQKEIARDARVLHAIRARLGGQ